MSYRANQIVHETRDYFVLRWPDRFEVCKIGLTHSVVVATLSLSRGLDGALAEVERRSSLQK